MDNPKPPNLNATAGAILLGTIVGTFLSGSVSMQTIAYFKFYWQDARKIKVLVSLVWFLDTLHTAMAAAAVWDTFIIRWGNSSVTTYIPWPMAVTVGASALMTFLVQCFFAYRVYAVSRRKLKFSVPIAVLAFLRLVTAAVSTGEMIRLMSYKVFANDFSWIFTLSLSLSSAVDIIVTTTLCYFLRKSRTGFAQTDHLIDVLTLYSIQSGLITTIVTIVALICWVTMPYNLIFIGVHLTICKLYANALLATLNARRTLRSHDDVFTYERSSAPTSQKTSSNFRVSSLRAADPDGKSIEAPDSLQIHVNIEKTMERDFALGSYGV